MTTKSKILTRFFVLFVIFIAFTAAVTCKILWVQNTKSNTLQQLENYNKPIYRSTVPHRGDILSRDGKKLAFSIPTYKIFLDYQVINSLNLESDTFSYIDDLAKNLSQIIGNKSEGAYRSMFMKGMNARDSLGKPFQYYPFITTPITYEQRKQLQQKCRLAARSANKGGIMIESVYKRVKPYGNMAARTIGKTGSYMSGLDGSFNSFLKGKEGMLEIKRDFGWNLPELITPGQDGLNITTTLDIGIQQVATQALIDMIRKQNAAFGCAVVMDVTTGEVLAMANIEKYNNGTYAEGGTNFATNYRSPPGSTFKLASMIALLESGAVKLTDSVNTGNGSYLYPGTKKVYEDTHANHWLTLKGIMSNSSNIGIIKLVTGAFRNKPSEYIDRLYGLGLNDKLGISLEEINPHFKHPGTPGDEWYVTDLPSMSIGYVEELAPIQILALYNAIANNGKLIRPRFVRSISNDQKIVKTFDTETIKSAICSRQTVKELKSMLVDVVKEGTAKNIYSNKYEIAGKTGTIEITDWYNSPKGRVSKAEHQASFCGFFPADNPKYSCIVVVNRPQVNKYGGTVAAVVFKQISDYIYQKDADMHANELAKEDPKTPKIPYSKNGLNKETLTVLNSLKIPTKSSQSNGTWISTQQTNTAIETSNLNLFKNQIPNVVGMGIKDALFCLESVGLQVTVNGEGAVTKQSLTPGSPLSSNSKISITLQ